MYRENFDLQVNSDDSPSSRFASFGSGVLTDRELLSLVVSGSGGVSSLSVADNLLAAGDGSLEGVRRMGVARLASVSGVTQGVAIRLSALWALSKRVGERSDVGERISGSSDIEAIFRPLLEELPYEEVWMVALSPGKRILARTMLSRGTARNSLIDIRLVLRGALDSMAAGVILVHNHPSDSCAPSGYDVTVTKQIRSALYLVDVKLLDHVILGIGSYFSFAEEGLL